MSRNTHQKQEVLNVLKSLRGQHPTAETVYAQVHKTIPSISRATVYRILSQFAEQNTINQLHIKESADRYDDLLSPHYHLLCNSCKNVVDFHIPHFQKVKLPKKDMSGCKVTGVEITLLGLCSGCAAKNKVWARSR